MKKFYSADAPLHEIISILTNNGEYNLCDVELGTRYKSHIDGSIGMHRRELVWYNVRDMRDALATRVPLSVEVGMILPDMPSGLELSIQDRRDFMKKRTDTFMVKKHLVFDWDIDHNIRTQSNICFCKEKQVCVKCWTAFAEPARMSLLRMLRYWMGFKQVVCVYSGRRGFHTWVLDDDTYNLTKEQRISIIHKISNPVEGEAAYNDIISILQPYYNKYHIPHKVPYGVESLLYELDEAPTIMFNHFIGVPLLPNSSSGNLRLPITITNFNPDEDALKYTQQSHNMMVQHAKRFKKK